MGIIQQIDNDAKAIEAEAVRAEEGAQKAYGDFVKETNASAKPDSADKRAQDSKTLTDKESTLAALKSGLEEQKGSLASTEKELGATNQYISTPHLECDWLIKYYDMCKEARANEIDTLGKAKAVLNDADYSLIQTNARARKFPRH